MKKEREFTLEKTEEPYKQLFVLTDELDKTQLWNITQLGNKRGIHITKSNTIFRGVGETLHDPAFTRMITVTITATSIDDKLADKFEGVLNSVLALVPRRCAVYDSSSQLYYRDGKP